MAQVSLGQVSKNSTTACTCWCNCSLGVGGHMALTCGFSLKNPVCWAWWRQWYPHASPRTCWLCSLMSVLCVPYPACLWIQQGHPVLGVTPGMCTAAGSGPVAAGSSKFFLLSGLPRRWRGGDAATGWLHTICKTTCSSRCGFELLQAGDGTKPTLPWPGWLLLAVGYSV